MQPGADRRPIRTARDPRSLTRTALRQRRIDSQFAWLSTALITPTADADHRRRACLVVGTASSSSCFGGAVLWSRQQTVCGSGDRRNPQNKQPLATSAVHLRSYARLGSRRRINHPGE